MPFHQDATSISKSILAGILLSTVTWIACGIPGTGPALGFFALFAIFLDMPWLAFVVAAVLLLFTLLAKARLARSGRISCQAPAVLSASCWFLYGIYEQHMKAWSETVTAPIRIDLLLIDPFLLAVTVCWLKGVISSLKRAAA